MRLIIKTVAAIPNGSDTEQRLNLALFENTEQIRFELLRIRCLWVLLIFDWSVGAAGVWILRACFACSIAGPITTVSQSLKYFSKGPPQTIRVIETHHLASHWSNSPV